MVLCVRVSGISKFFQQHHVTSHDFLRFSQTDFDVTIILLRYKTLLLNDIGKPATCNCMADKKMSHYFGFPHYCSLSSFSFGQAYYLKSPMALWNWMLTIGDLNSILRLFLFRSLDLVGQKNDGNPCKMLCEPMKNESIYCF